MAAEHYTLKEALSKLALSEEQLGSLVREGRIREFRIGGERKYSVGEINDLAAEINPAFGGSSSGAGDTSDESAIELLPVDASDGGTDVVSLEETGEHPVPSEPAKEDTVITPAGVSVFDEDELAGLDADPMAKTQIAPSLGDELSLERGGDTGSGLLDLARESDDTSLGGVLDEIPPGQEGMPRTGAPVAVAEPDGFEEVREPAAAMTASRGAIALEIVDPLIGVFTGLVVVSMILLGFSGVVAACLVRGVLPDFVQAVASFMPWSLIIGVLLAVIGPAIGYFLSKR